MRNQSGLIDLLNLLTIKIEKQAASEKSCSGRTAIVAGRCVEKCKKAPDDHLKETSRWFFLGRESRSKDFGISTF
tara:strand:- start:141 stop:365 length:225 start_codon:yes stop_codon:yes gene_type:complete